MKSNIHGWPLARIASQSPLKRHLDNLHIGGQSIQLWPLQIHYRTLTENVGKTMYSWLHIFKYQESPTVCRYTNTTMNANTNTNSSLYIWIFTLWTLIKLLNKSHNTHSCLHAGVQWHLKQTNNCQTKFLLKQQN